jgi:DNA-binding transcriptional ArsR family regulator
VVIEIRLGPRDLGRVRFASDAVWETAASLNVLSSPRTHLLHRRLASRLPRHPPYDADLLTGLTGFAGWIPDTLAPTPLGGTEDPRTQLARIEETAIEVVEADQEQIRARRPGSRLAQMSADQFRASITHALTGYFVAVLEPIWERVHAITEADIAHHRRVLTTDGLEHVLPQLHGELSMSDGIVRAALSASARLEASGEGIWFVPSVFRWPWLAVDIRMRQPVISYAARGAGRLWEETSEVPDALAALLGQSRASILEALSVPRTTTALAGRLGLAASTVSQHLTVMTDSGLLTSRRDGRRVLYSRTLVGDLLVRGESALAELG